MDYGPDLVISCEDEDFVCNVTVTNMIFNPAIVDIKLATNKPGLPKKRVTYRKYRAIDITQVLMLVVSPHSPLCLFWIWKILYHQHLVYRIIRIQFILGY